MTRESDHRAAIARGAVDSSVVDLDAVDHDRGVFDIMTWCERLAERLRSRGFIHPVPAALALTARGYHGADTEQFAVHVGLDAHQLSQIERGEVAFAELPDAVAYAFARIPTASLLALADIDARVTGVPV